MKRPRVPGTLAPRRVWTTAYACSDCGQHYVHVEASEADDEPLTLPLAMRVCVECGGILWAVDQ